MLIHPRKSIKDSALSYIGIARQGKYPVAFRQPLNQKTGVHCAKTGGTPCQSHFDSPLQKLYLYPAAVLPAQGDNRPPDEVSGRVAKGAVVEAFHLGAPHQAHIPQPPAHSPGLVNAKDKAPLAVPQLPHIGMFHSITLLVFVKWAEEADFSRFHPIRKGKKRFKIFLWKTS